jgi:hypothetical protein
MIWIIHVIVSNRDIYTYIFFHNSRSLFEKEKKKKPNYLANFSGWERVLWESSCFHTSSLEQTPATKGSHCGVWRRWCSGVASMDSAPADQVVYCIFQPIRRYFLRRRHPPASYKPIAPFTCTKPVKIASVQFWRLHWFKQWRIWQREWINEWWLSIACWTLMCCSFLWYGCVFVRS